MAKIETIRHSLAHIMASAVKNLYPKTKFGMGPDTENGFYYDFDFPKNQKISTDDLGKIEKEMKKIIKEEMVFNKSIISKEKAKQIFKEEKYKLEIIKEITNKKVTIYQSGSFIDLCSGPHIKFSKEIQPGSFKLIRVAGAYFKGDEKREMLTRIYGLAFETEKELKDYFLLVEEMKKRDHRKLGKELDLFCFSDIVGPGLPMYTPKGTTLIEQLKKKVETICRSYGFEKVSAPSLAKIDLFEISGHAKKFGKELFRVNSEEGHSLALKPVQCPHHTQIYASKIRSYKDLPIRYMESDKQYRAEKPGEVGGLNRVYAITVEDGHSFCTVDQVKEETKKMVEIIKEFYTSLGLWDNHKVYLSFRDYQHPEKYIGDEKDWNKCEKMLKEINKEMDLNAEIQEGEAALYGPKIDFMFKDALGKEIQIPTVQVDFSTAKRFNLFYISESGKKVAPVMVHRAILGSYERFIALLIEHFAGAFPLWLSPIQVEIINIGEKHKDYVEEIYKKIIDQDIRAKVNTENLTLGKKIREAETQRIPYIVIIGDKEIQNKEISVRKRGKGDIGSIKIDKFIEQIKEEKNKKE